MNIIVAGQSNAKGRLLTPGVFANPLGGELFKASPQGWQPIVDPVAATKDAGMFYSIWPQLMDHLATDRNEPVRLVTIAEGATGFVSAGTTPKGTGWAVGGYLWRRFLDTVQASGIGPSSVLFVQGEEDSFDRGNPGGGAWRDAVEATRASWQAEMGWPALPMYLQQVGNLYATNKPWLNLIRAHARNLWDEDGDFPPAPVTCDIAHPEDSSHYTLEWQRQELIRRWRHFIGGGARGPRIDSASRISGMSIGVDLIVGNGTLDLGAAPTVGWRVADASGPCAVTEAAASWSRIMLTLDRSPAGIPRVSWGYDNDASGATLHDGAGLPPEPFTRAAA